MLPVFCGLTEGGAGGTGALARVWPLEPFVVALLASGIGGPLAFRCSM